MKQPTLALVDGNAPERIEEKSHTYRGGSGIWQPGVTGLLRIQDAIEDGYPLERWKVTTAVKAALLVEGGSMNDVMDAAFDAIYEGSRRGSRIHEGIDAAIQGDSHIPTPGDGGYWYAWMRFLIREKPEINASEMFCLGDGYGGTFDLDVNFGNERAMIDTKTGKYYPKYRLQLAGYSDAKWRAPKKTGQPVEPMPHFDAFYALMLAEDGTYQLLPQEVTEADREHFRFLVDVSKRLNAWKETA